MALKSTIYELLKRYLDEYLYGFAKDQLDVALLSGQIELINVNFKPAKVNDLLVSQGIPFYLKSGLIGKLKFKYNYRNILTNPVEVSISDFYLILGPIIIENSDSFHKKLATLHTENSAENDYSNSPNGSLDKSRSHYDDRPATKAFGTELLTSSCNSPEGKKGTVPKEEGFFEKYITKIIVNLTLVLANVHIRYEDEIYPYRHPFSLSIVFESLLVNTAGQEWYLNDTAEIKKRATRKNSTVKEGKIKNLGIYLVSMSGMLIPTSLWEATLHSEIGIFDALAAYEIRDLLVQERNNQKNDYSSTLLSPLNIDFSATLSKEKPLLKLTAVCDTISIQFSSAMSECLRNLHEYYTSAKIWEKIRKYRPSESIIKEPRADNEPSAVKERRTRIVRNWFVYAMHFVKLKKNLKLTPGNEGDFKENKEESRVEAEEVGDNRDFQRGSLVESGNCSPLPQGMRDSIFMPKEKKKTPGRAMEDLNEIVREYNNKLSYEDVLNIKAEAKPLPNESEFFPVPVQHSEIDFKSRGISIVLIDEETELQWDFSIETIYCMSRINLNEVNAFVAIDHIVSNVHDGNQVSKILEFGLALPKHHTTSGNKQRFDDDIEKAVEILCKYRPAESKKPNEEMPALNMYELQGKISDIHIEYSHLSLNALLIIFETFKTSKASREWLDIEYMKKIERKRESLTQKERFVKKQRQVLHNSVFTKLVLTKKIIRRILQWQGELKAGLKSVDSKVGPILMDCKLESGGLYLHMLDNNNMPVTDIFLPRGLIELFKDHEFARFSAWGFGIKTREPFKNLYKHLHAISNSTSRRLKRMKTLTKRALK